MRTATRTGRRIPSLCLGLSLAAAAAAAGSGCWASSPSERGDFGLTEVALFTADDGPFCVAAIDVDEVEREVLLLDYMNGVHHYSLDGTYLETSVNELAEWSAINAQGLAYTGDSEAVIVGDQGGAFRMELAGGAVAPLDLGTPALGPALAFDDTRGRLLAVPADAPATWGPDAATPLLVLDGATAAPAGELSVALGRVKAVTYAVDRDELLVLGPGGELLFVDPETGETRAQGFGPDAAFGVAYDVETGRVLLANWALSYRVHTYEIDWH